VSQAREAVQYKLGGPFDYDEFREELRLMMTEKDMLFNEFKSQ